MLQRRAVVYLAWLMVVNSALCARLDAGLTTGGGGGTRLSRAVQAESVRKVGRERGRRIESLLRPFDDVVEVIDEQPYGLAPPPPQPGYPGYGKPEVQRRVEATPFIALVRIEKLEGELTASGDWVRTTVHCKISQLFKALPELNVAVGAVTLRAVGGELRIGRQRVRARHTRHRSWRAVRSTSRLPCQSKLVTGTRAGSWRQVRGTKLRATSWSPWLPVSGKAQQACWLTLRSTSSRSGLEHGAA
jgi:hypothetical protein